MTDEQLKEIEARASAATEGPWDYFTSDDHYGTYLYLGPSRTTVQIKGEGHRANAAFIVSAREDVPALIEEVRRLRATLDAIAEYDGDGVNDTGYVSSVARAALAGKRVVKRAEGWRSDIEVEP